MTASINGTNVEIKMYNYITQNGVLAHVRGFYKLLTKFVAN